MHNKGNIVLDSTGVIGLISEVFENYSVVMLYTDPLFKIPVKGVNSDNHYILTGTGRKGVMQFEYVSNKVMDIEEEEVITSGEGGVFVSGLKVGKVQNLKDRYFITKAEDFASKPFLVVLEE